MITGRTMGPQEGLELGIVNYVYPAEQLMSKVEEYARTILTGATRAIGLIKQAVVHGAEVHLEGGLFMERELQNRLFISEDAREGIAAWTERRQPEFHGR
jgi:enoyl-CoA hydratase/carnithine racemase